MPSITSILYILNFLNLDEVFDLSNINPTIKFLIERHDKTAITDSKIFYLDPFTLRTYEDTDAYCHSLNMTVALPTNQAENDLIAQMMRGWNTNIRRNFRSAKFDWIEAWLAVGLGEEQRKGLNVFSF